MNLKLKSIKLGAADLKRSTRKNKKWMVKYGDHWIHFGDSRYQDYTQHRDKERQKAYLKRARGIKNKQGRLTYTNKNNANFWAINILWT
mgnify:CR=1 FL=1